MIDNFRGKYYFLSNFFSATVEYEGITYLNNEAAFQAAKLLTGREIFQNLNPSEAKRLGRRVDLRPDWEEVKTQVMFDICYAKFKQHPELMKLLLETSGEELVEGNTWGDKIWGVCKGVGENRLGRILMLIRDSEICKTTPECINCSLKECFNTKSYIKVKTHSTQNFIHLN